MRHVLIAVNQSQYNCYAKSTGFVKLAKMYVVLLEMNSNLYYFKEWWVFNDEHCILTNC